MPGTRSFSLELRRNKMEPQYSVEWSSPTEISTVLVTVVLPVAREDGVMIPRRVCAGVNWISAEVAQAEAGFWCLGEVVFGDEKPDKDGLTSYPETPLGLVTEEMQSEWEAEAERVAQIAIKGVCAMATREYFVVAGIRTGAFISATSREEAAATYIDLMNELTSCGRILNPGEIPGLQGPESVPRRKTADNGLDRCRRIK